MAAGPRLRVQQQHAHRPPRMLAKQPRPGQAAQAGADDDQILDTLVALGHRIGMGARRNAPGVRHGHRDVVLPAKRHVDRQTAHRSGLLGDGPTGHAPAGERPQRTCAAVEKVAPRDTGRRGAHIRVSRAGDRHGCRGMMGPGRTARAGREHPAVGLLPPHKEATGRGPASVPRLQRA